MGSVSEPLGGVEVCEVQCQLSVIVLVLGIWCWGSGAGELVLAIWCWGSGAGQQHIANHHIANQAVQRPFHGSVL